MDLPFPGSIAAIDGPVTPPDRIAAHAPAQVMNVGNASCKDGRANPEPHQCQVATVDNGQMVTVPSATKIKRFRSPGWSRSSQNMGDGWANSTTISRAGGSSGWISGKLIETGR